MSNDPLEQLHRELRDVLDKYGKGGRLTEREFTAFARALDDGLQKARLQRPGTLIDAG
jgi:hypothetical protein